MIQEITCQQCRFSIGRWMEGFTQAVLFCSRDNQEAPETRCGQFEREPGTMEREGEA